MSLQDLPLKAVYKSDHDNILRDFYIPSLSNSISYDRAVGFFSAAMLSYAAQGLDKFIKSDGKMRLIVGAELESEEHDAVMRGYDERNAIIEQLGREFQPILAEVNTELFLRRLQALQWLVANSRLDIKVAIRKRGMYHEKIGIMRDSFGNFIVFQGSANESVHALVPDFNYESVNVFRSWREGDREHYDAHIETFEELWEGRSPNTLVIDFPEIAKNELLRRQIPKVSELKSELDLADHGSGGHLSDPEGPIVPDHFSLFRHQLTALEKWKDAGFTGILNLATGTGKTCIAIYAAARIYYGVKRLYLLITVPYQSLAEQWIKELKNFNIKPILCCSLNNKWKDELDRQIDEYQVGRRRFAAAVVVNATMASSQFQEIIRRLRDSDHFLFVGDECHYHGTPRLFAALPDNAALRMGLSATYQRQGDEDGTRRIEEYYGGVVASYTLGDAINNGFLTPYDYKLELVDFNAEELIEYLEISEKIRSRMFTIGGEDPEKIFDNMLDNLFYKRARLLGRLESKLVRLGQIVDSTHLKERTLIYCGEGTCKYGEDDDLAEEEIRSIDLVTKLISSNGYRVTKFTSRESPSDRRAALEGFRTGSIQVLTAIRCLDEGVDIPTCETAFILASSRNPRQFIQRRGRILRKSPGKTKAVLWDFLPILPASDLVNKSHELSLLRRELGRISEFSRHSCNFIETYRQLEHLLEEHDLGPDFLLGTDGP